MTEWRRLSIPLYRAYEVSSEGAVRRDGRELKGYVDRYGYRTVLLSYAGLPRRFKVHRLVCEAFNGPCPEGRQAAHLNGKKADNSAGNLAWVSRSENERHKFDHGTRQRGRVPPGFVGCSHPGEKNPRAKLTNAQAAEIRLRTEDGASCRALGREYGVSKDAIHRIKVGTAYSEADETPNPKAPETGEVDG
jgi:hypothetical protein